MNEYTRSFWRQPIPSKCKHHIKSATKDLKIDSDEQPLSCHVFRLGAAFDQLEQSEPLESIMLRGVWQADLTAIKYLRDLQLQ